MPDSAFQFDRSGLQQALELLGMDHGGSGSTDVPQDLPEMGIGELESLAHLAPAVLGGAQRLDAQTAFAHMDPPTPWITWAMVLWNASLNQNLLHPDVSPQAGLMEKRVVDWLTPFFGMDGGHMTSGSTIANLAALWAARETRGVTRVVASTASHLSVAKAAHILGLDYQAVGTDAQGRLDANALPDDLDRTALVLTAGATSTGAIDPLGVGTAAAWRHVDAAWAGPMRLSKHYAPRLDGVEQADSVAVSAHKWFFQPKDSALIFFRDTAAAHKAISFGGAYLAAPNVGVQGSRGAAAVPLLATLLAWGREGLARRIEHTMEVADALHDHLQRRSDIEVFGANETGVILWRPVSGDVKTVFSKLPHGMASTTKVGGVDWIRQVAANPNADIEKLKSAVDSAFS